MRDNFIPEGLHAELLRDDRRESADMLPKIFPAFPNQEELDIYATMTPAKEVGGDFYDFFMLEDDHLALVIADVNNQLNDSNDEMLFVTVWLGILELSTGRLTASNAGHEHPAIAVMPYLEFTEHEFMLKPGDCVYVYTDGVTEANNEASELFGEARMIEALNRHSVESAKDTLLAMQEEIGELVDKYEYTPDYEDDNGEIWDEFGNPTEAIK